MLESLFNKVTDLDRLEHKCFPMNFGKFKRKLFLHNTSGDYFWTFLTKQLSLFTQGLGVVFEGQALKAVLG